MTAEETWRNSERTGDRDWRPLSNAVRPVRNVRHLDLDMYQYDPETDRIEIVMEATADGLAEKPVYMTVLLARLLKCYAITISHVGHDDNALLPIDYNIYSPLHDWTITRRYIGATWEQFQSDCAKIHADIKRGCLDVDPVSRQ